MSQMETSDTYILQQNQMLKESVNLPSGLQHFQILTKFKQLRMHALVFESFFDLTKEKIEFNFKQYSDVHICI